MRKLEINDIKQFLSRIQEKSLVCFGAGKKLDEICRELPELVTAMDYILDNNPALNETDRVVLGEKKKIYTIKKLEEADISKTILVITSSYKLEILTQLNRYQQFAELEYCDFEKVFDMIAWSAICPPPNFRKNVEMVIPKKIHYIWFGGNPIPESFQNNINGWKRLCEDYEIICWNEDNYDISKNPYMHQAYKDKKWSFVSDYARLDIVYQHGGIYLDTDVEMLRSPDELLYNDAFIGFERTSTVNTGSGFGARKEFPIIKEMRDFYNTINFVNKENPNEMILCPEYETAILQKHGLQLNGNFQIIDDMSVYPVMYFNAKSLYSDKLKITEETISVHHCSWTWAGNKSKLARSNE